MSHPSGSIVKKGPKLSQKERKRQPRFQVFGTVHLEAAIVKKKRTGSFSPMASPASLLQSTLQDYDMPIARKIFPETLKGNLIRQRNDPTQELGSELPRSAEIVDSEKLM